MKARRKETEPILFHIVRKLPSIFLHQVLRPHISICSHAQSTCYFFTSERSAFTECGLRYAYFWVLTLYDNCVSDGLKGRYFRIVEGNSKINCEVLRFDSFTRVDTNKAVFGQEDPTILRRRSFKRRFFYPED
jgi:hypothetical protein